MKRSTFLIPFFFLAFSVTTMQAQTWSKNQEEVLSQLKECYTYLPLALQSGDLSTWTDNCPCDKDFAVWNTQYGAPSDFGAIQNLFEQGIAAATEPPVINLRPVRIKIAGDMAAVFYYVDVFQPDPNALMLNFNGAKRLTILHRVNGKWQLFADMVVEE